MTRYLNILVRNSGSDRKVDNQVAVAEVRDEFEPIDEEGSMILVTGKEFFDEKATSFLGGVGDMVTVPDRYELQRAIATLRERYGRDIPVEDNLGVLPESLLRRFS